MPLKIKKYIRSKIKNICFHNHLCAKTNTHNLNPTQLRSSANSAGDHEPRTRATIYEH